MMNNVSRTVALISVIVPVYNGEKYLSEALESVFAQDYRPLEVIVVDDGSTDGTAAIARRFPQVCYIYQVNQGPAVARNAALNSSRGDLITFLDADDVWAPNSLLKLADYLARHPGEDAVFGMILNFLEAGMKCPPWIDPATLEQSRDQHHLASMLARRSLFEAVGQFNCMYRLGEDLEWLFRLKESGKAVGSLAETVLLRRVHESNISHNQSRQAQIRLRMLKESIDRKRRPATPPPSGGH
jgi:glycosyltransferase involved in cell wall biosynthesis